MKNRWKKPGFSQNAQNLKICQTNRKKSQLKRLELSENMKLELDESPLQSPLLTICYDILPEINFCTVSEDV